MAKNTTKEETLDQLSDNLNGPDLITTLEIAYQSIKWPKDREKIGDLLDLSDQYLETLGLVLSGLLSDKVETL